jgi:hypothetical protein
VKRGTTPILLRRKTPAGPSTRPLRVLPAQALLRVCKGCTVIGLDVLDQYYITTTLRYITEFKPEVGRLKTIMPSIWGLHNYSDVNSLQSWRTRELIHALGGQVWLTETGGIVKFGRSFPASTAPA